jgi:phosphate uptake regulator
MKRKVIQLAGKTFVVSLPSKWVKAQGIRKGQEVDVEAQGAQLTISSSDQSVDKKISVDVTSLNTEGVQRWLLSALHKAGYDEIEISYKDARIGKGIQDTVRDLMIGFAVVEQLKNKCIIRLVAREQEKEFDSILRRAFLVTKALGEGLIAYLESGQSGDTSELLTLEKTNNQLTNFCERILNKKGRGEKTCFWYVIAWNLEKICDDYKKLAILLQGRTADKIAIASLKGCNEFFAGYYELFYTFSLAEFDPLNEKRKIIEDNISKEIRKGKAVEAYSTMQALLTKVADLSASYIAIHVEDSGSQEVFSGSLEGRA